MTRDDARSKISAMWAALGGYQIGRLEEAIKANVETDPDVFNEIAEAAEYALLRSSRIAVCLDGERTFEPGLVPVSVGYRHQ